MAATSTPDISSVYSQILADYPDITFAVGTDFQWSAAARTITHPRLNSLDGLKQFFHEIGHAQLDHADYARDIELIDMERQAWSYAASHIAPHYGITLSADEDIVQDTLDSYRQWLHDRSTCPNCSAVGRETAKSHYLCLSCTHTWRVNEARTCRLKRSKLQIRPL